MKTRLLIILLLTNFIFATSATNQKIDSLKILIEKTKIDTLKSLELLKLAEAYDDILEVDSALKYSKIGYNISVKAKFKSGLVQHLVNISVSYVRKKNQTKALKTIFQAFQIAEENNLQKEILKALNGVSFIYTSFDEYREAIKYKIKYWKKYEQLINDPVYKSNFENQLNYDSLKISMALGNLSTYFLKIKLIDSSLYYGDKALSFMNQISKKDPSYNAYVLNCLGSAYNLKNETSKAISLFKKSIQESLNSKSKRKSTATLYKALWELAIIFKQKGEIDSSNYYALKAYQYCSQIKWDKDLIEIQNLLANNFTGVDNTKAVYFYQQSSILRDSLFNKEKAEQLRNITFNELEREKEIEEQKIIREEERKKQIQFSLIAFGIIISILLFIILSRSFITNDKTNAYFATLVLLMIFEFFNLLISPYIGIVTSNIPILSFVTAISMALILSPIQDHIKKWLTSIMTKKKTELDKVKN